MSTSFVQFQHCELCRLSHKKGKKHVYSKHHQEIVKNIILKFGKKVQAAKKEMNSPLVQDYAWELGAKFWCYFCAAEIDKHGHIEGATVKHTGLLEHLTGEDHRRKLYTFFWEHRVDKEKKTAFVLSKERFQKFQEESKKAVDIYIAKKSIATMNEAERIRRMEEARKSTVYSTMTEVCDAIGQFLLEGHMTSIKIKLEITLQSKVAPQRRAAWDDDWEASGSGSNTNKVSGMRTATASGEGLSSIQLKEYDSKVGNIYTDTVPPWLRSTESDAPDLNKSIGPTLEDLHKHVAQEKKRKLPATRVGAEFDRGSAGGEQWLPSFGGVWNHGRRLQTKQRFLKNPSNKKDLWQASHMPVPRAVEIKPYVPKSRRQPSTQASTSPSAALGAPIPISSSVLGVDPPANIVTKTSTYPSSTLGAPIAISSSVLGLDPPANIVPQTSTYPSAALGERIPFSSSVLGVDPPANVVPKISTYPSAALGERIPISTQLLGRDSPSNTIHFNSSIDGSHVHPPTMLHDHDIHKHPTPPPTSQNTQLSLMANLRKSFNSTESSETYAEYQGRFSASKESTANGGQVHAVESRPPRSGAEGDQIHLIKSEPARSGAKGVQVHQVKSEYSHFLPRQFISRNPQSSGVQRQFLNIKSEQGQSTRVGQFHSSNLDFTRSNANVGQDRGIERKQVEPMYSSSIQTQKSVSDNGSSINLYKVKSEHTDHGYRESDTKSRGHSVQSRKLGQGHQHIQKWGQGHNIEHLGHGHKSSQISHTINETYERQHIGDTFSSRSSERKSNSSSAYNHREHITQDSYSNKSSVQGRKRQYKESDDKGAAKSEVSVKPYVSKYRRK